MKLKVAGLFLFFIGWGLAIGAHHPNRLSAAQAPERTPAASGAIPAAGTL